MVMVLDISSSERRYLHEHRLVDMLKHYMTVDAEQIIDVGDPGYIAYVSELDFTVCGHVDKGAKTIVIESVIIGKLADCANSSHTEHEDEEDD